MSIKTAQHRMSPGTSVSADSRVVSLEVSSADRPGLLSPAREKLLEALLRSLSAGEYVTVVSGVAGGGKSLLLERLQRQAHPDWSVCLIRARHALGEKHVLEQLNTCFCPGHPVDLAALSGLLAKTTGRCVIIVDDAHKLTTFALEALFNIKQAVEQQDARLGLVLFAQPAIRQLLSSPSLQRFDAVIRHVDLPALTPAEGETFIDQWLARADRDGTLCLTPTQKQNLYRRSGGVPGRLNTLIELAVARQGQQNVSDKTGSGRLPQSLRMVSSAIVVMLAFAGGFWFMTNEQSSDAPVPPTAETAESVPSISADTDSDRLAKNTDRKPAPQRESDSKPSASLVSKPAPVAASVPTPPSTAATKDKQASSATDTVVAQVVADQETQSIEKAMPVAETAKPVPAEDHSRPITPPGVNTATPVADEQTQAVATQESPPATDSAAAQGKPTAVETESVTDGQTWLLAQDGEHYTVQLAASLDREAIERFVGSRPTLADLHSAHIKQRGRDWFISLYGAYPGLAEARAAVAGLPSSMRKNSPWIRQLARIQALVPVTPDVDSADTGDSVSTSPVAAATATSEAGDAESAAASDSEAGGASAAPADTGREKPVEEKSSGSADPVPPPVLE